MSREQMEAAFSQTIENILEVVGHSTASHLNLLGERSIEIAVQNVEDYLKLLKNIREEYRQPTSVHSCMSPLLNDSMLVHRNRLAGSSRSRLNQMRNSPAESPMEVDRGSLTPSRIAAISVIAEESTFLDETRFMDESTHLRGFLADVSELNSSTARSRQPSYNFDQISPVSSGRSSRRSILPVNSAIDFDADADVSSMANETVISRGAAGKEDLRTPRAVPLVTLDDSLTPTNNLWNVTLRSGSNRKISEEIRREIQRQLAREE